MCFQYKSSPKELVGMHAGLITEVSSTYFPGHYHRENSSWNLKILERIECGNKKIRNKKYMQKLNSY